MNFIIELDIEEPDIDQADEDAQALAIWLEQWLDPAEVFVHTITRVERGGWLVAMSVHVDRTELP